MRDRIDSAASDSMQSLLLETAGHSLFDMYPERRGEYFIMVGMLSGSIAFLFLE